MKALKAEIRVIGIDDGGAQSVRRIFVGAIFRGGSWLDGVIVSHLDVSSSDLGRELGVAVLESRFYQELRFAILHGSFLNPVEPTVVEFAHTSKLPTIAVLGRRQSRAADRIAARMKRAVSFRLCQQIPLLCIDLTKEHVEAVFRITCTRGSLPEPVRVARLITSVARARLPKRLNSRRVEFRAGS